MLTREELLALPVSAIVDGWTVKQWGAGDALYLFLKVDDGHTQTIIIPRETQK